MSRRRSREVAMQALFQLEINNELMQKDDVKQSQAVEASAAEGKSLSVPELDYATVLVDGVVNHLGEIDELIEKVSKDWKVSRMVGIDRNILRLAVFEIKWGDDDVNEKIAINEAVELAKKFGTDDSAKFINGILGAITKA